VVDAVRCAVEIQHGMAERELDVPEDRRIRFRVGINIGDVIADKRDIFGDGVNVAARLEALAEPGGICISRVVRDQIRDKLPYPFEDKGEQTVKNIARPVRVYALRPETIAELPIPGCAYRHAVSPCQHCGSDKCGVRSSARHRRHCMVDLAGNEIRYVAYRRRAHLSCAAPCRAAFVDCRAAVCQSQQRPRAAIFCRRDHLGFDHQSVAASRHVFLSQTIASSVIPEPAGKVS
jgi:hypothetical protein